MRLEPPFRLATRQDCPRIAEQFNVAVGGVPEYVWTSMADDYPNLSPFEIGELRYGREDIPFSYRNTVVAEIDDEVVGILVSFPIEEEDPAKLSKPAPEPVAPDEPDVMKPYRELEIPDSYYVCCVALLPRCRGRGLGTRFMGLAREEARRRGFKKLSLLAFEENAGSVRLYQRLGYRIVDSQPVEPHPLITYTGNVLLMAADV